MPDWSFVPMQSGTYVKPHRLHGK